MLDFCFSLLESNNPFSINVTASYEFPCNANAPAKPSKIPGSLGYALHDKACFFCANNIHSDKSIGAAFENIRQNRQKLILG